MSVLCNSNLDPKHIRCKLKLLNGNPLFDITTNPPHPQLSLKNLINNIKRIWATLMAIKNWQLLTTVHVYDLFYLFLIPLVFQTPQFNCSTWSAKPRNILFKSDYKSLKQHRILVLYKYLHEAEIKGMVHLGTQQFDLWAAMPVSFGPH